MYNYFPCDYLSQVKKRFDKGTYIKGRISHHSIWAFISDIENYLLQSTTLGTEEIRIIFLFFLFFKIWQESLDLMK